MRPLFALLAVCPWAADRADIVYPSGGSGQPATQEAAAPPADFDQMLREAYELIDDEDPGAAVRALQYLVKRAPPRTLAELSARVHTDRGVSLAELLADTRLRHAISTGERGRLHLRVVTRYEAEAMGRAAERRLENLSRRRYHGRTVFEWADEREAYTTLQPDARRMVADARLAAALSGARLKHDPRLKKARKERLRLIRQKADLARFAARVAAMRGFTAPLLNAEDDPSDPAAAEVRRRRELRKRPPSAGPTTRPASGPNQKAPADSRSGPRKRKKGAP